MIASFAIALAGVAFVSTAEIGWAEYLARTDKVDALERAVRLTPENADFHARIATLDPARDDELKQALALNPNEPSWWIMRAVGLEQAGDPAGAEKSLRQATLVSDYFVPWWSLAAFYYRQEDAGNFISAAHHALSAGAGDAESIFRMAENLQIPAETAVRQLVPDLPKPLEAWLAFALKEGNLDDALSAALRLTAYWFGREPEQSPLDFRSAFPGGTRRRCGNALEQRHSRALDANDVAESGRREIVKRRRLYIPALAGRIRLEGGQRRTRLL